MTKPAYRPGRRRRPLVTLLLGWAAGVLIGGLLVGLGLGAIELLVDEAARGGVQLGVVLLLWPIGAALGVWLAGDRPWRPLPLIKALALAGVGAAVLSCPIWLALDPAPLRSVAGIATLLLVPALAKLSQGRL